MLELGWKAFVSSKEEDILLPDYQEGQLLTIQGKLKEGKTQPPSRITETSLLKLMTKYGLGTPATRAEIIKKIQEKGYVQKEKKTGIFKPTKKAYILIDYLHENMFAKVETTAKWEYLLKQIGEGNLTKEEFVAHIEKHIIDWVNEVKTRIDVKE